MNKMQSNMNNSVYASRRYYGTIGTRAVWMQGKKAQVHNPVLGKQVTMPLRQILQQGTGQESMLASWMDETHSMQIEQKTIRDIIRDAYRIKSS